MLTAVLHQHGAQQFWGLLLKHLNISGFRMQVIALVSIYKTFFWPKAHLCRERRDLHTGALKQSEGILAAQHPLPLRTPLTCPKQTQLLLKEDQASPDLMHCLPAATAAEQGCKLTLLPGAQRGELHWRRPAQGMQCEHSSSSILD